MIGPTCGLAATAYGVIRRRDLRVTLLVAGVPSLAVLAIGALVPA